MVDAKSELDRRLRTVINDFVGGYVARMAFEIGAASDASATKSINTTTTAGASTLDNVVTQQQKQQKHQDIDKEQPPPPPKTQVPVSKAISSLAKTRSAILQNAPHLKRKLEEYIENSRTREMLLAAVLEGVLSRVEQFYKEEIHGGGGGGGGGDEVDPDGTGKGADDDDEDEDDDDDDDDDGKTLWRLDRFVRWCVSVFGVRRVGLAGNGAGDGDDDGSRESGSGSGSGSGSKSGSVSGRRSVGSKSEDNEREEEEEEEEEEEDDDDDEGERHPV